MIRLLNVFFVAILAINSANAQTSPENVAAAIAQEDKAKIAMMKKDYDTAYDHLKNAMKLDPANSAFLNSAAYLAMEKEDFKTSLSYLNKALELDKEKFGQTHANVASVLNNIASIYSKMENHTKAIEYLQQSYDMFSEIHGEKHPQATFIKGRLDAEKAK